MYSSMTDSDDLKKPFLLSLALHGLILILFYLFSRHSTSLGLKKNIFTDPQIKLLSTSVRVDVVAMPKDTLKELKQATLAPPVEAKQNNEKENKAQEEESDEGSLKKYDSKKSFMNLLKKFSGKETTSNSVPSKGNKKTLSDVQGLILSGNKLAKGNSVTGSAQAFDEGAFAMYVSLIPSRVKPHWKLPSYLLQKNLKCRIRIYINREGELIRASIYESSGVDEFDDRAVQAIEQAAPFPKPEESYLGKLINGEIALGFPL
jgi:colicin import membrane protein